MSDEYMDAGAELPLHDRRGTDNAPAEGRRSYDKPDAAAARLDTLLDRVRNYLILLGLLFGAGVAVNGWLGARNLSPGARQDNLQQQLDRETTQRVYGDSALNVRMARIERYEATRAYQACIGDGHMSQEQCLRLFTDGVDH